MYLYLSRNLDKIADEVQAKKFLEEYNSTSEGVWNAYTEASWAYNTDINEENKQNMVRVGSGVLMEHRPRSYCTHWQLTFTQLTHSSKTVLSVDEPGFGGTTG